MAYNRAQPPPTTTPSSTAALVALSASVILSLISPTSTSEAPPTLMIPTKLARLLEINRNENKSAVAHKKIIAYHFSSDEVDIQVFTGIALPVLPRAVEWNGQDATGFNLMYHVTRGIIPTLTRMWPTLKYIGNYRKRKEVDE